MNTPRQEAILTFLAHRKTARNQELCQHLHCSLSTLRRDLIDLEDNHFLQRSHGGVVLTEMNNQEFSHIYRAATNVPEKKTIARLANDFIAPGMCIFLDSSSTVLQLIPFLEKVPNLIVITNGLVTALHLSECHNENMQVFVTGGEVKINTSTVISNTLDLITGSFRFNAAFFSCRGLDEQGIYEASFSQAQMKKEMMNKAEEIILLADDTKFDSTHFFKIGDFADYHAIITNKQPKQSYHEVTERNDIHLIYSGE